MAQYVYKDIILARWTNIQRPNPVVKYWGLTLLNTPTWFPLPSYYIAPHFNDEPKKIFSTSLTRQYINERAYTFDGDNEELIKCHILVDDFYNGACLGTYLYARTFDMINISDEGLEWSVDWNVEINFRLCDNNGKVLANRIGSDPIHLNDNPVYFNAAYFETDGTLNQNDVNLSSYCCFSKNQQNKLTIMTQWWTGDVNSRIYIPFDTMKNGNPVWTANLTTQISNYAEYYTRDVANVLTVNFITLEDEAISDYSGTSSGYGTWDTSSDDIGLP